MKFTTPLLLLIFILSSCALKNTTVTPTELNNNGLLVGRITGDNPDNFILNGDLTIDGKEYKNALKNGYLMLSLEPGAHTIQDIGKTTTIRTSSYQTTTTTKRITLNRKLTIKPSQITNLGIIVVLSNINEPNKFKIAFINNNSDMEAYLGSKHPDIYNSLSNLELLTAEGKYLDKKEIRTLRNILLNRLPENQLSGKYTGTILGTMAKISRNEDGEVQGFSLYNTQTFEDIKTCSTKDQRIACIIPNFSNGDRLMMTVENGLAWRSLPKYQAGRFYLKLIGDTKIILVTDRLKVFSSIDYAKSWNIYTGAQLDKPIGDDFNVGFTEGENGYYIYSKDLDSTLIYNKFTKFDYRKLETPDKGTRRGDVQETNKGLYIGPEYTEFGKGKIFFKANGQNNWVTRDVPSTQCNQMSLISHENDQVAINCESQDEPGKTNTYISSDTGQNWVIRSDS
jgi:hypothetical protein